MRQATLRQRGITWLTTLATVTALTVAGPVVAPQPALADNDPVCSEATPGAFIDVLPTNLHAANIDCVAALGIAMGVGGRQYAPHRAVTREQMATYLVNLVRAATGEALRDPAQHVAFTDIGRSVHATNIRLAVLLGITSGRTPTTYEPGRAVTREQMASFVTNTLAAVGVQLESPSTAAFVDLGSSVHADNINRIGASGIVNGTGGGRYDPKGTVSRAQMATFLISAARYLDARGMWRSSGAETDEGDGPVLTSVGLQDEEVLDLLVLAWDRDVALDGTNEFDAVYDESNDQVVASGRVRQGDDGALVLLDLDADLSYGGLKWLRIPEGVVVDEDGNPNPAIERPFIVAVGFTGGSTDDEDEGDVDGEDGSDESDDDGSDGSDGSDGEAGGDDGSDGSGSGGDGGPGDSDGLLSVVSVVTKPSTNEIVVRFSEPVFCPNTANGREAWQFYNLHASLPGESVADGAPDSVAWAGPTAPDTCNLYYGGTGISDSDWGVLDYNAPAQQADLVMSSSGEALNTLRSVRVEDGNPVVMLGMNASSSSQTIMVRFSKPISCVSLRASDLQLRVNGELLSGEPSQIGCTGVTTMPVLQVSSGTLANGDSLTVVVVGSIASESGYQSVPIASSRTTTVE